MLGLNACVTADFHVQLENLSFVNVPKGLKCFGCIKLNALLQCATLCDSSDLPATSVLACKHKLADMSSAHTHVLIDGAGPSAGRLPRGLWQESTQLVSPAGLP